MVLQIFKSYENNPIKSLTFWNFSILEFQL